MCEYVYCVSIGDICVIYVCILYVIYTHIDTYIDTHIDTYRYTNIHRYSGGPQEQWGQDCGGVYKYTHTSIHTHMYTCTYTHTYTYTWAYTLMYIYAHHIYTPLYTYLRSNQDRVAEEDPLHALSTRGRSQRARVGQVVDEIGLV